jgi:hypothetical protein
MAMVVVFVMMAEGLRHRDIYAVTK